MSIVRAPKRGRNGLSATPIAGGLAALAGASIPAYNYFQNLADHYNAIRNNIVVPAVGGGTQPLYGAGSRFNQRSSNAKFAVKTYSGSGGPGAIGTTAYRTGGSKKKWRRSRKTGRLTRKSRKRSYGRKRKPNWTTSGCQITIERSGTGRCGSGETMYVGHAAATAVFWENLCRVIIRHLFKDAGEQISSWQDGIKGATNGRSIQYWYTDGTTTTDYVTRTISIVTPQTYDQLARALFADFQLQFTGSQADIELYKIFMFESAAPQAPLGTLMLAEAKVMYEVYSKLKLQNTSLAGTTTAEADDDVTDNVTRNPVYGKTYISRHRGNGFRPTATEGAVISMIANPANGMFAQQSGVMDPFYRKPPFASTLRAKVSNRFRCEPGEIKIVSWRDVRSVKLNKLIDELQKSFGDTQNNFQHVGYAQMVAFEKEMNCATNENPIAIHYALEQDYKHDLVFVRQRAPRIVEITAPAGDIVIP
jgi:hypothetical protein